MAAPSSTRTEFNALIDEVEEYLRAQQELYGGTIFMAKSKTEKVVKADRTHEPKAQDLKTAGAEAKPAAVPPSVYPDEPWVKARSLKSLDEQICTCVKCPLGTTRTKFVFGTGNPHAEIMFVGEAPGADEDKQGEPFVGRAGQLLNKILAAVDLKREDVYICNVIKCRPPGNREPLPMEMETCSPYLYKQIDLVKPKFIVCLGRTSAQWLLQTKESLGGLRQKVHDFHDAKVIVTYHPAALLRNEAWKRPTWEDMKMLKKMHDEMKKA